MIISEETVRKLAHLSRIELDENEVSEMKSDLGQIVDWMDKLKELDTKDTQPLTTLCEEENVFRADESINEFTNSDAILNAPEHEGEFFKVPRVIS